MRVTDDRPVSGDTMGDPERRQPPLVVATTGRRIAAARVGRRWADVRGPLLAATALALVQAAVVYLALRAIQELDFSLFLIVPIVAATTLTLVLWMGLVRHAFGAMVPLGQAPAAEILAIIDQVRQQVRGGLTPTTAKVVALEIHARLGYGAVAISDRERILAHVGLGGDHHGAGTVVPPGAAGAMAARRVARLPVGWRHGCDARSCPLKSAVVAPISDRVNVLGSLILFSEGALNVSDRDRAIADQLARLVGTELAVGEVDVHRQSAANAELAALQAQIEPHFLFNALNTIAAFCRTQPDEARRLVLAFAAYCRATLRRPQTFITLDEEMGHVDAYVALELARFGSDLEVELRISDQARRAPVPPFSVQPLVENAIRHGKTDRPLRVVVSALVRFDQLRVTVRDNGRGVARPDIERMLEPGIGSGAAGLGLSSVDQRLEALYGDLARLRIVSSPYIGTRVSILVPVEPPTLP